MRKPTKNKPQYQCLKCPWKVSTNPHEIPRGYDVEKHRRLTNTIAEPGALVVSGALRIMACHDSSIGNERPCVGWLHNQLGDGNNILLRLVAREGGINTNYILDGEQHSTIEDTFPDSPERCGP